VQNNAAAVSSSYSAPSAKKRRGDSNASSRVKRPLSLKLAVIKHVDGGASQADAAVKFEVNRTQVSRWCAGDREKIIAASRAATLAESSFKIKAAALPRSFEQALLTWVGIVRSNKPPLAVSYIVLQTKAVEFSKQLQRRVSDQFPSQTSPPPAAVAAVVSALKDFKFSDGWVTNFFRRYSLGQVVLHGEGGSAPMQLVDRGRIDLHSLLADYELSDIYNADEFALFYELLPSTSADFVTTVGSREVRRGFKKSKARLTGLVCTNADGSDKLKPLIIGRAKVPVALRRVNMDALPCTYRSSKKGWMNNILFTEFLNSFNARIRRSGSRNNTVRKVILLIDGAGCHGHPGDYSQLSNTTVQFFPPNCTSHLQPLDAGIIRALKARYRSKVIDRQLRWFETARMDAQSSTGIKLDAYRPPNVRDAINMLASAWRGVTELTICRCWRHTRILPVSLSVLVEEDARLSTLASEDVALLTESMRRLELVTHEKIVEPAIDFVQIDDEEPIEQELKEEDIVKEVLSELGAEEKEVEDEEEDVVELEPTVEIIGQRERMALFKRTIQAIEQWEDGSREELTGVCSTLRDEIERAELTQLAQQRQSSITQYFR
jgi:hypothetical protein